MKPHWLPLLVIPLLPVLWGFTPFTKVRNVCPGCRTAKSDLVVLTSGTELRCKVLAQNDDYYVLSRFGELRALPKNDIRSIKWEREGGAASLGTGDQVLLKNGTVLHGSVVEEQAGRHLVIQVGLMRHPVWFGQIQSLHKGGRVQDLTAR